MLAAMDHSKCPTSYSIEVGKGKSKYKVRYTFCRHQQSRAHLYYNSLNTHSGYKKRLIRITRDGVRKVLARVLT